MCYFSVSPMPGVRVLFTALMKHNWHTIWGTCWKCAINGLCHPYIYPWSYDHNQDSEDFHPQQFPQISLYSIPPPSPLTQTQGTTNTLSVATDHGAFSRIVWKWNHKWTSLCVLCYWLCYWLIPLAQYNYFESHPWCWACWRFVPFHCWVVLRCMDIPKSVHIYPFTLMDVGRVGAIRNKAIEPWTFTCKSLYIHVEHLCFISLV